MQTLHAYAFARDCSVRPESDLDPKVAAILKKMSQVTYVLDQHNIAVARHSRTLAELSVELDRLRRRR